MWTTFGSLSPATPSARNVVFGNDVHTKKGVNVMKRFEIGTKPNRTQTTATALIPEGHHGLKRKGPVMYVDVVY